MIDFRSNKPMILCCVYVGKEPIRLETVFISPGTIGFTPKEGREKIWVKVGVSEMLCVGKRQPDWELLAST